MKFSPGIGLVLGLWLAGGSAPASTAEVPPPPLEGFDHHIRAQLEEGRQAFESAVEAATSRPEAGAAHGALGRLYLAYDLVVPARAALGAAVDLAPANPAWAYYLGYLEQQEGELDRAASLLQQALDLEPGDPATTLRLAEVEVHRGQLEAATKLYRSILGQEVARAAANQGLARIADLEGDPGRAAEHYRTALTLQPFATRLHYPLAQAYRRLGESERARAELTLQGPGTVASPDPRLDLLEGLRSGASVHLLRAMMDFQAGRLEAARQEYERAVAADPQRLELRQSYAAMLEKAGDLDAAVEQLRAALELEPNNALTTKSLGRALARNGAPGEGIEILERAVELDPSTVQARLDLARLLEHQGRPEAALERYREALELEPWSLSARFQAGVLLIRQGRMAEAAEELARVVEADPSDIHARLNLGSALAALGRWDAAEQELRRVMTTRSEEDASDLDREKLRDSQARARFNLALLIRSRAASKAAEGADTVALTLLETAMAEFPGSGELAHALARLLATSSDPEVRDGARALELATAVFRARQSLDHAETLAMALAELGRFQEAVGVQMEVLEMARREGAGPETVKRLEEALGGYRRDRPVRGSGG